MSDGFEPLSRLPPTMLKIIQDSKTHAAAEMAINTFWLWVVSSSQMKPTDAQPT